jgi:hypothetical protein
MLPAKCGKFSVAVERPALPPERVFAPLLLRSRTSQPCLEICGGVAHFRKERKMKLFMHMTTSTKDKSLDRFLDVIYNNQRANRARFSDQYQIIQRVDHCFVTAGKHLSYQKPVLVGPLFLRSQYAYKTAAGMSLAGQVAESFVMARSCLEYAGYALAIFADPGLEGAPSREELFVNRNIDGESLKAQKAEFQMSKIRGMITNFDEKLAANFKLLYDRSIDYGGHPNPYGLLTGVKMETKDEELTAITTLALTDDPLITIFAMKNVAQVGLTSLCIFQHICKAKFELLGIRTEMDALKMVGL